MRGRLSEAVRTLRVMSVNRQDGRGVCTGKSVRAGFQGTTGVKPERAERRRLLQLRFEYVRRQYLRQQDGGLFSGGIPDIERYAVAPVGFKRVADGFVAVSPVGFEKRDVFSATRRRKVSVDSEVLSFKRQTRHHLAVKLMKPGGGRQVRRRPWQACTVPIPVLRQRRQRGICRGMMCRLRKLCR